VDSSAANGSLGLVNGKLKIGKKGKELNGCHWLKICGYRTFRPLLLPSSAKDGKCKC